jgi:hypothetical protein
MDNSTRNNPPILTHTRLPDGYNPPSSVTGRYASNQYARDLVVHERSTPLKPADAYYKGIKTIQRALLKRAQQEGLDGWSITNDLTDYVWGSYAHPQSLMCPVCGGENLHQVQMLGYPNDGERIIIAFSCEHCIAEPHMNITQHKGLTSIFWDAEMLLRDYGVFDEALLFQETKRVFVSQCRSITPVA